MKDIQEITQELAGAQPGTQLSITGYTDSDGNVYDVNVELLSAEEYQSMLGRDLEILRRVDVSNLQDAPGGSAYADLVAARSQLIDTKAAALQRYASGEAEAAYKGAQYTPVPGGGSLATLAGIRNTIYLMRLKVLGAARPVKPAKGSIPRAKQVLSVNLDLPTRYYIHTLGLAPGKFEELQIIKKSAPAK